ncbi:hypothetical protein BH23PLA1_BH23PLA1_20870 [soil metagenome]
MGLDLTLGALICVAALRGWFRGFFAQTIRLGGLIGCVYLAAPLRDLIRPAAAGYLPSIRLELLDKLLWWASAVLAFVVVTGLATWVLKAARRHRERDPYAIPSHRGDQSAGALFGAVKGAIVVMFLAAGINRYAPQYLETGGWVGEQVQESRALVWSDQYQPALKIWEAEPVQNFIGHVRKMGLEGAEADAPQAPRPLVDQPEPTPAPPVRTAQRPRPLKLPPHNLFDPASPDFDLEAALKQIQKEVGPLPGSDSR